MSAEFDAIKKSSYLSLYEAASEGENEDKIHLEFYEDVLPVGWYGLDPVPFIATPTEEGKITYKPPPGYHYLLESYVSIYIPTLKIKKEYNTEYRFRWDDDLAFKIAGEAILTSGRTHIQSIDYHWMIFHSQFFNSGGHNERFQKDIGNMKKLTAFQPEHKWSTLQACQPWFYSKHYTTALPLFKFGETVIPQHTYNYILDIEKLICMQRLEDDSWVDIESDINLFEVQPDFNNGKIRNPVLYGLFSNITPKELSYHNDLPEDGDKGASQIYYIEDIIKCDAENAVEFGQKSTVLLKSKQPAKAIIWGMENQTAVEKGNRGNYTSNSTNFRKGCNPMASNTLNIGSTTKFKEMSYSHLVGPLIKNHFTSSPTREGINGYSFINSQNRTGIDVGILLMDLNSSLTVLANDPEISPYIKSGNAREKNLNSDRFLLICRVIVLREMTFNNGVISFDREPP